MARIKGVKLPKMGVKGVKQLKTPKALSVGAEVKKAQKQGMSAELRKIQKKAKPKAGKITSY